MWRVIKILFQKTLNRDGKNQNTIGKNKIPKNELSQFKDKLKIVVEGSKIENKFIIIFKLKKYFYNLFYPLILFF